MCDPLGTDWMGLFVSVAFLGWKDHRPLALEKIKIQHMQGTC